MERNKKYFYLFIHFNFLSGFIYALYHFLSTPKSIFLSRRLWAYECWIILSFYCLFIFLILLEKDIRIKQAIKERVNIFRKILLVNLLLLIFPWGLFLIIAPADLLDMLRLTSFYWRLLGVFSLLGAIIYYFPYRFYSHKLAYYIFVFGSIDNLVAGLVVSALFLAKKIPLLAFSSMPLLFYFSSFFYGQAASYRKLFQGKQK